MLKENISLNKVESLSELEEIIINFDEDFEPSLKNRVLDLKKYSEKLYNNAITIKASYNKKIIGFASFYCNDVVNNVAYLTQIAVKEEARSMGIGRLLLDEVIKIGLNNGMKDLKLEVNCNNLSAIKFYEENGFVDLGVASADSKYMQKVIRKVM